MADAGLPIEERKDVGREPDSTVRFWLQQLKLAEKEDERFVKRGRQIVRRFRDERSAQNRGAAKFNILWANVEVLKPVLYGRTPKPDVERRHKNDDALARMGAQILERALSYEDDLDEFDEVMRQVVEDRLLPGRGMARVFYEPEFGPEEEDETADPDEDGGRPIMRPVTDERAPVRYIFWEDYRATPARTHREEWWRAYRSYMTRAELVSRFGEKIGKDVTLDYSPKGTNESDGDRSGPLADAFKKAEVWEIWDRTKKEAVWIATGYTDGPLDKQSDPLKLPGFFPSPDPLDATTTNDKTVPVADYSEYQDQAIELDILTARIDRLVGALKVAGVYAASEKATLQQLLDPGQENQLIPVEDWAAWADKGGIQNMILWLPIDTIAKVLVGLYDARDRVQKTLYELTGIADILRGETNPNETLGAQQLKGQFASRRISRAQQQVARFARGLIRLRGCVMARHFSAETLSAMTGFPEPQPPMAPAPPMMIPAPQPQPQQMPAQAMPQHMPPTQPRPVAA